MPEKFEYSIPKDVIGKQLVELAKENSKICVLSSDVSVSVNIEMFKEAFSDRFYEMGIAEQSTVSVAGGLAIEGFIPVYVALAIFSNGMTFPQTRQICNNQLNVKIIGTHAGVDDGQDGPGHHSTEDLAISRAIPRLTVLCPSDENEVAAAVREMINIDGPVYMRVAREEQPIIHLKGCKFEIGKAEMIYDEGNEFAIIFEGSALKQALEGWQRAKKAGKKGKLINIRSVKPLDEEFMLKISEEVDVIITVENHSIVGGLYSAICETLSKNRHKAIIKPVGFHDEFMDAGKPSDIKKKYGLDSEQIVNLL